MDIKDLPKLTIRGSIAPKAFSFFDEEVFSASDLSEFLQNNKDASAIVIEISSPGGYVNEGFEIYDMLKACGKEVITIGFRVNSIAVLPFLAGNKRYVTKNCEFWIHNARLDAVSLGIDVLTATDLKELAADIAETDKRILKTYRAEIGSEHIKEIKALMNEEKNLKAEGAIQYGFAHGYYDGEVILKPAKVKNFAVEELLMNKIINKQNMENERLTKMETKFDQFLNRFKRWTKGAAKNEVTFTSGDKTIVIEGAEGEDIVGKKAVYADEAGLPTSDVVPAGEHVLDDGRILVVGEDGIVSEIKDSETVEALKNKIKELETQITTLTTERDGHQNTVTELQNNIAEMKTAFTELQTEFKNFKNEVPGDPDNKPKSRGKEGEHKNTIRINPVTGKPSKTALLVNMSKEKYKQK